MARKDRTKGILEHSGQTSNLKLRVWPLGLSDTMAVGILSAVHATSFSAPFFVPEAFCGLGISNIVGSPWPLGLPVHLHETAFMTS